MKYLGRDEYFHQQKLENLEIEAIRIQDGPRFKDRPKHQHIPPELTSELDLPLDMESCTVNFEEVIKKDCSRKRRTPHWSGQDVLEIGLNNELSMWVTSRINAVRVWPQGMAGFLKKARVLIKMVMKHSLFGSAMTTCVLLNTVVMGMERYNMDEATV